MIKVLVVDDSAVVRKVLSEELSRAPDIEVVATAVDPYVARDKILSLQPDVVTLDIEMPRMDGLTFLSKLMKYHPLPVVIVSSVTPAGSDAAVRALQIGALDVISKPGSARSVQQLSSTLVSKIRAASRADFTEAEAPPQPAPQPPADITANITTTHKILAIGGSTGGTRAIKAVLEALPGTAPATLIAQHMPEHFTSSFAQRLDATCDPDVREAHDTERLDPGVAIIAPGNRHLVLNRSGTRYIAEVNDGPRVHHQRPSVDVLFHSVARNAGRNAIGVLLTGMGKDGARGLAAIHDAGGHTIAQNEETSVVYGMPREAVELGAADEILPLNAIASHIMTALQPT